MVVALGMLVGGYVALGAIGFVVALVNGGVRGALESAGVRKVDDIALILNLCASVLLMLAFDGFLAADLRAAGALLPDAGAGLLYACGIVLAYVGFVVLSIPFPGELFKMATLIAAVVGYPIAMLIAWQADLALPIS